MATGKKKAAAFDPPPTTSVSVEEQLTVQLRTNRISRVSRRIRKDLRPKANERVFWLAEAFFAFKNQKK